jgi:hypothetical protein
MTSQAPKPILSDFDRMFEEQFPGLVHPADAMARRSIEHRAGHDRNQVERPKSGGQP